MRDQNYPKFLHDLIARVHVPSALVNQLGWTTVSYAFVQVFRFATNLVLTHILAPDLFGIMMLLTSFRVGIELFTDIGIGQNLVANKGANDPRFYNTACSIQIVRGVVLAVIALLLIPVVSQFYTEKQLHDVLPTISMLFILAGSHSVGLSLAVKVLDTKSIGIFEVATAAIGSIGSILFAFYFTNIWGLVAGNLFSTLVTAVGSYFVFPGIRHRFMIDIGLARQMIGFGKWVFISSVTFFFASNYDRLILGTYVSLGMLGIYGIARSLSDVFSQFAIRLGNAIVFPSVAGSEFRGEHLRERLLPRRAQLLTAMLVAIGLFTGLSDVIVRILYDSRYSYASAVLPWLALATWVGILNTLGDAVLLGISSPRYAAYGNLAKFFCLLIALPIGVSNYGIVGAAGAAIAAELARYTVLSGLLRSEGLRFYGQDFRFTVGLLVAVAAIRVVAYECGLSSAFI